MLPTGPRPSIGSPSRLKTRPERFLADGHLHRFAGVDRFHAAHQAVGGPEGDAADAIAAQVLLDLAGEANPHALGSVVTLDLEGVIDLGQVAFLELGVEGRADNLDDLADMRSVGTCHVCSQ